DTHFDSVTTLPADLVTTGMQVNKFSGHYVEISSDPKWFNWDAFDAAVDNYHGSDFVSIDIDEDRRALPGILDWIVDALHNQLDIQVDESELRANVYSTFTNLQWAHSSGFADFSESSSGTNSSWEYRTVYAYRQPGDADKFFSMVTTIQLEADVESESWWWGLVGSTTATFEATITAEKFGVTKGFKDPA
ncbi:delta-endotoxin CytB, partial [Gloeophyllum trabeum ATCC 11539]